MVRIRTLAWGAALALGGALAYRTYQDRSTEQVPYETVDRIGPVELRRYPGSVLAETVADSNGEAFRRLFRYISGENDGGESVEMTAPVESDEGTEIPMTTPVETGRSVSMTAPVETDDRGDGVRMAFYLPAAYDYDTAPRPTDPAVRLVEVPPRTLAAIRFSWWPTDGRVRRYERRLLDTLRDADGVTVTGDPFTLGYEGPGTLPFLRRNEVAVVVTPTT